MFIVFSVCVFVCLRVYGFVWLLACVCECLFVSVCVLACASLGFWVCVFDWACVIDCLNDDGFVYFCVCFDLVFFLVIPEVTKWIGVK